MLVDGASILSWNLNIIILALEFKVVRYQNHKLFLPKILAFSLIKIKSFHWVMSGDICALCDVRLCTSCIKISQFDTKIFKQKAQLDKIHPVPENHTGIGANVSDCYILKLRQGSSLLL